MDETPEDIAERSSLTAHELRVVLSRLRGRLQEIAGARDLTPAQTAVLGRLAGGAASAGELAAVERVRPQSMAATLAALDRHGLLRRDPDPGDARRQLVSLSEAGGALVQEQARARADWLARAVQERWTPAERGTVREALALLDRLTPS